MTVQSQNKSTFDFRSKSKWPTSWPFMVCSAEGDKCTDFYSNQSYWAEGPWFYDCLTNYCGLILCWYLTGYWFISVLSHSPFYLFGRWLSSRDDDGQIIRDLPTSDVIPGNLTFNGSGISVTKKKKWVCTDEEAYVKVNAKGWFFLPEVRLLRGTWKALPFSPWESYIKVSA